jgi:hypothetical protein
MRSHTLQPKWYKVLKVFILLGFLAGYFFLFGWKKTLLFFVVFILLSAIVHFVYRIKTRKWKQSWLDFIVIQERNEIKTERIGKYYYSAIIINAILSVVVSQLSI